jgi:hypothetical protein
MPNKGARNTTIVRLKMTRAASSDATAARAGLDCGVVAGNAGQLASIPARRKARRRKVISMEFSATIVDPDDRKHQRDLPGRVDGTPVIARLGAGCPEHRTAQTQG